jgi:hypothetical protein
MKCTRRKDCEINLKREKNAIHVMLSLIFSPKIQLTFVFDFLKSYICQASEVAKCSD